MSAEIAARQLLYKEFLREIDLVWGHEFKRYGKSRTQIGNNKTRLSIAVHEYITKKVGDDIAKASRNTIYRILTMDDYILRVRPTTLTMISVFLGYDDWDDFQVKVRVAPRVHQNEHEEMIETIHEHEIQQSSHEGEDMTTHEQDEVKESTVVPKNTHWKRYVAVFLCIGILLVFLGIFFVNDESDFEKGKPSREELIKIIKLAAEAEFNSYLYGLSYNMSILKKYFTSTVISDILGTIESAAAKNRCLIYPESSYRVIEVTDIRYKRERIEIVTIEYWRLKWCDKDANDPDKLYDVKNTQEYHLILSNDQWLIDANIYEGTPRPAAEKHGECNCHTYR